MVLQKNETLKIESDFITFFDNKALIRLTNPENEIKILHQGTIVAQCREVIDDCGSEYTDTAMTKKLPLGEGDVSIGCTLNASEVESLAVLLQEHIKLFAFTNKTLGKSRVGEFTIDTEDENPVKKNPYTYSLSQREDLQRQINEMIKMGVVAPSSAYSLPVVLVKKNEGLRMCVDLRRLNPKIKNHSYPMPNTNDYLSALQGARYF